MLLACLLASAVSAAEPSAEHRAPAETLAVVPQSAEVERLNTLAEMRRRRIVPPDSLRWSPEDAELLARMREAEGDDAVEALRKKGALTPGMTVSLKKDGQLFASRKLTREGFDAWLGIRSREALDYFELKGVEAKWGFKLVSLEGKALFDGSGRLTATGVQVYRRAALNLPVWWKTPPGEIFGTRPPPKP